MHDPIIPRPNPGWRPKIVEFKFAGKNKRIVLIDGRVVGTVEKRNEGRPQFTMRDNAGAIYASYRSLAALRKALGG